MAISQKGIQNISAKLQSEKIDKDRVTDKLGLSKDQKVIYEFNQYNKDPISYREKYGDAGVNILLQQVNDLKTRESANKKGGRIKYQSKGKVSDVNKKFDGSKILTGLAGEFEKVFSGAIKTPSILYGKDLKEALKKVKNDKSLSKKEKEDKSKRMIRMYTHLAPSQYKGTPHRGMQYGGMADMSAAPMVKQQRQRKRSASGFRAKYAKGGGVRSSKYKL